MGQLTIEQSKFIVKMIIQYGFGIKAIRKFHKKYCVKLQKNTVRRIEEKWKEHGTVHNPKKGRSGRQKNVTTEQNIDLCKVLIFFSLFFDSFEKQNKYLKLALCHNTYFILLTLMVKKL